MLLNSYTRCWSKFLSVASAAVVVVASIAAGTVLSAPEPASVTFIGPLQKAPESARLAIISDGKSFAAYTCSSDDEFNKKYASWIRGKVEQDGTLAGTAKDGLKLEGKIDGKNVTGKLIGPSTFAFSLTVSEKDASGLYRSEIASTEVDAADKDHTYILGAIVDQKGEAVGSGFKVNKVDPTKKIVVVTIVSPRDLVQGKPFQGQINGVGQHINLFQVKDKLHTPHFQTIIKPTK